MTDLPRFRPVADHAVLVELATEAGDAASAQVVALDHALQSAQIPGVTEWVPALVNLLVCFDPMQTDHKAVTEALYALFPLPPGADSAARVHVVPVCYDPAFAPDLDDVAQACGLTPEAVIAAHGQGDYRVCMYGFAPGYAYLSGVPSRIQVPRKPQPLRDIPAGSILIAGAQCLATTLVMPTGWSIIGRTPARILRDDPHRPFLFDIGDRVVFEPVTRDAYEAALATGDA